MDLTQGPVSRTQDILYECKKKKKYESQERKYQKIMYQGGFILLPYFNTILRFFLVLEPDYGIMKLYISTENLN